MSNLNIAIIGVGSMGSAHARSIAAGKVNGMKLAALVDPKLKEFAEAPDVPIYASTKELWAKGGFDCVLIATPHYDHTTIGIESLEKGYHTLVEKPISVHKADCEKLIAAAKSAKGKFAAMFNQRTNPAYQKIRELIQNGDLGSIQRITWVITDWFRSEFYYQSGGWRATWKGEGGGVLLNQCPHQLDLWQWMFGMPSEVRAFCQFGQYHDIEVEDVVTAYLGYENGTQGVFVTTTGEAPGTNRLEVAGDKGKLIYENGGDLYFHQNRVPTQKYSKETDSGFGRPENWKIEIPIKGKGNQHQGILQNFTDSILNDAPLLAPAEEGIHSVELANAMLFSSFQNDTIKLPIDSKAYEEKLKDLIANSKFEKKVKKDAGAQDLSGSY